MLQLDTIQKEAASRSEYTSDFYKIQEGANNMRIMTDFVKVETITKPGGKYGGVLTETNKPNITKDPKTTDKTRLQGWAWAIIRGKTRAEDEFKVVQFGNKILTQLVALRSNPDYGFETMPMPYDININAKNAGDITVEYTVMGARQNTEVTADEMEAMNKKKSVQAIVQAMTDKQDGKKGTDTMAPLEYPADVQAEAEERDRRAIAGEVSAF